MMMPYQNYFIEAIQVGVLAYILFIFINRQNYFPGFVIGTLSYMYLILSDSVVSP